MAKSWTLRLPCTRKEAEALSDEIPELAMIDPQPAILTQELIPFDDSAWELVAYFDRRPDKATIALIQSQVPSAATAKPAVEELDDEDWVTISQRAIEPVQAGRFYVHTSSNKGDAPVGSKALCIEASRAFGTGSHETTAACLSVLDNMKRSGMRFGNIADIGTGTGLLAFAALHLWPRTYMVASDIDPVSIDVTKENADENGFDLGRGAGQLSLCVAPGADHSHIQRRAPYDLIIANILAGPLISLAPSLVAILEEGGTLLLAGLLNTQKEAVLSAYRTQGMRLVSSTQFGDWPALRFVKRRRFGWRRPRRAFHPNSQPPGDYGTW